MARITFRIHSLMIWLRGVGLDQISHFILCKIVG